MQATSTSASVSASQRSRISPHERLTGLGMTPLGRASEFADDIYALMAKTPLFSGLDMSETRILGAFMYVYDAPAGLTLINEGDSGDFMVLLMSGMVDVLRRNRYNYPSRIAVAHAGHALGEMSMFDGEPRYASCWALSEVEAAVISREAVGRLINTQPAIGAKLLVKLTQLLAQRLRNTSNQLVRVLQKQR